jgi:membrane fusion protein, copper/silver efflux system
MRKWLLIAGVGAVCFAGGWWLRPSAPAAARSGRQPLYWHDPMHPAYRSDKPGVAPDCGMQLTPVYGDSGDAPAEAGMAAPPGTVRVPLDRQQVMGLRRTLVGRTSGAHVLRVSGRVAPDESRIYRVTALADGVIRSVASQSTGNIVQKDDLLATYFVPAREIYTAMQSLFMATTNADRGLTQRGDAPQVDLAKAEARLAEELLATYGVTERQIKEMIATRQATRDIQFRSPTTGIVLSRSAEPGQRVDRGTELFRIADMSRVRVLADVFENDSGLVRAGAMARVRYGGRLWHATVAGARQFDAVSRTMKVQLDMDNPEFTLRPDMFVDVELDVREPEGISLPVDAVLDAGRTKTVFVSTASDVFEAREVTTGVRYGDRVQILQGLREGESVVVSGLFLLDSENRLQRAAAASSAPPRPAAAEPGADPVCGMQVDPAKTEFHSEYKGASYSFCSKTCKASFDSNPATYAAARP